MWSPVLSAFFKPLRWLQSLIGLKITAVCSSKKEMEKKSFFILSLFFSLSCVAFFNRSKKNVNLLNNNLNCYLYVGCLRCEISFWRPVNPKDDLCLGIIENLFIQEGSKFTHLCLSCSVRKWISPRTQHEDWYSYVSSDRENTFWTGSCAISGC